MEKCECVSSLIIKSWFWGSSEGEQHRQDKHRLSAYLDWRSHTFKCSGMLSFTTTQVLLYFLYTQVEKLFILPIPCMRQAQGSQVNADVSTSAQEVTPSCLQLPQKGYTLANSMFNQTQRKLLTFSVIFRYREPWNLIFYTYWKLLHVQLSVCPFPISGLPAKALWKI